LDSLPAEQPTFPDPRGGNPRPRSTGPRTLEGKARSSMNRLVHGCRSQKLVLRHEDPAEFEATIRGWFEHYAPEDPVAVSLVEELAKAHWFLKRAQKRLAEVEWELPMNAYHWTDTHQRLLDNFTRYKVSAERSFLRYLKELEAHLKRLVPALNSRPKPETVRSPEPSDPRRSPSPAVDAPERLPRSNCPSPLPAERPPGSAPCASENLSP
jgi:hypothetical protein